MRLKQILAGLLTACMLLNPMMTAHASEVDVSVTNVTETEQPASLVAYFDFDTDISNKVTSSSLTGTIVGSGISREAGGGVSGGALKLTKQASSHFKIGQALNAGANNFTLSTWVKYDSDYSNGVDKVSLFQQNGNGRTALYINANHKYGTFLAGADSVCGEAVTPTRWHLVTMTWNAASKEIKIYVNDSLKHTATLTGTVANETTDLLIGGHKNNTAVNALKGTVDELRVYNEVLDAASVTALYNMHKDSEALQTTADMQITVKPNEVVREISEGMFGINHRYHNDGYGTWNTAGDAIYPNFHAYAKEASFGSIRYPGGTVSNLFEWKRTIGPVSERKATVNGSTFFDGVGQAPIQPNFGVDEAMTWIVDEMNAQPIWVYGLGRGSAADAADLIEYLNAPADGDATNPGEGIDWAEKRKENGHAEPYNVTMFEIGNEMGQGGQTYWLDGKGSMTLADAFINGGEMTFDTSTKTVKEEDWRTAAANSDGSANQVRYTYYAPLVEGSVQVYVGSTQYTVVDSLAGKGRTNVCTVDYTTGKITFGDGTNGNIPASGAQIKAGYRTRQDGFLAIYEAMKERAAEIGIDIKVLSGIDHSQADAFINKMASQSANAKYDGMSIHPYSGTFADASDAQFYEKALARTIQTNVPNVRNLGQKMKDVTGEDKIVAVSEFGIFRYTNAFIKSLGHAIYIANEMIYYVDNGAEYLNKHCLVDFVSGTGSGSDSLGPVGQCVIQSVPQDDGSWRYVSTPSAKMFAIFNHMSGTKKVANTVTGNGAFYTQGSTSVPTANFLTTKDDEGNTYVIAVNNAKMEKTVDILVEGVDLTGRTAEVWYVTANSVLAENTLAQPALVDVMKTTSSTTRSGLTYTLAPNSVTGFKIAATGEADPVPGETDPHLVAYFDFDENILNKIPGSTLAGEFVGRGISHVTDAGISGGALNLTKQAGTYFKIGNAINASTNDFTLSTWVKYATDFSDGTNNTCLFQQSGDGRTILYLNASKKYGTYLTGNNVAMEDSVTATTWHLATVTWDASAKEMKIYVNGELKKTATLSGTAAAVTTDLLVGGHKSGDVINALKGSIDELRIYDTILGADAIAALFDEYKDSELIQGPKPSQVTDLQITVKPENLKRTIWEGMFGINHRYHNDGYGTWNTQGNEMFPEFDAYAKEASFGSIRYPGGTVSNLFEWKRAIGPVEDRKATINGSNFYTDAGQDPIEPNFGVDEAMTWIVDEMDAKPIWVYGMGQGSASDAADLVEYLNAPADGNATNPGGGEDWAEIRKENGHSEPYNVTMFEIGNEVGQYLQDYWMAGRAAGRTIEETYTNGGTMTFATNTRTVKEEDWRKTAAYSDGTPGQVRYTCYSPLVQGSVRVFVGGTEYSVVPSLEGRGAANVCTVDYATGKITFGDGTNGNIPANGQMITAGYQTTQDGFVAIYDAMHDMAQEIGIEINVLSGVDHGRADSFINLLNSQGMNDKYEGMAIHPYSGNFGSADAEDFYEKALGRTLEHNVPRVVHLRDKMKEVTGEDKIVAVSEFGIYNYTNSFIKSLGHAIYIANEMIYYADLGAEYLNKHCLVDFVSGDGSGADSLGPVGQCVIQSVQQTDGSYRYVSTPSAKMFSIFNYMSGTRLVENTVSGNGTFYVHNGTYQVPAVNFITTQDEAGNTYVIAVNNRREATEVDVFVEGMDLTGKEAEVWYITADNVRAENNLTNPDLVDVVKTTQAGTQGGITYNLAPNSVTGFKIAAEESVPVSGNVTIAGSLDKVYDGQPVDPGTLEVNSSNVEGDVTFEFYGDAQCSNLLDIVPKDAGTYWVKASVTPANAQEAVKSRALSFTISKAALTINGANLEIVNTENGQVAVVSQVSFEGLKNQESLIMNQDYTATASGSLDDTPAVIEVIVSLNNTATAANYVLSGNTYSVTVNTEDTAGSVTIAGSLDKVYDGLPVDPYTLEVNSSNVEGNVTFEFYGDAQCSNLLNIVPKAAGTYWVKASMTAANAQVAVKSEALSFTISKAPLTVSGASVEIVNTESGQKVVASQVSFEGLKNQESLIMNQDYTATVSGNLGGTSAVMEVSVSLNDTATAANYILTSNTCSVTVNAISIGHDNIWVMGLKDLAYTGAKQTQNIRVFDGDTELKEKTDYTILYRNNKNGYNYALGDAGFNAKKAPQVIIKMKGNYKASKTLYFKIIPQDISDEESVIIDNLSATYTGKKQTPVPTVIWNGKNLKNNKDYTVLEYVRDKKVKDAFSKAGTYTLTLEGKGNFIGTKTIEYVISQKAEEVSMSKVSVKAIKAQTWTSEGVRPAATVSYKRYTMVAEEEYTVEYEKNHEVGTGYVVLEGTGVDANNDGISYIGTRRVGFKINGNVMSKAKVNNLSSGYDYTGDKIMPLDMEGTGIKVTSKDGATLEKDVHYTVAYQKNVDKGTATMILTGIPENGYSGVKKQNFKIVPATITGEKFTISLPKAEEGTGTASDPYKLPYTKGGVKPVVEVTREDGTALVSGKDYSVTYKNNKAVAGAASIIIKGKGNYAGSISQPFEIVEKDVSVYQDAVQVVANDKVENTKKNGWKQNFKVYDEDGKALNVKDYDAKSAVYTVEAVNDADGKATVKEGDVLSNNAGAVVPAGSIIRIEVTLKGNYKGTVSGTYRILKTGYDISKATIRLENQQYTGEEVLIDENKDFKKAVLKSKGQTHNLYLEEGENQNIRVVEGSYQKNILKGTAKVTFEGIGEFGGRKTVTFKIGQRSIADFFNAVFDDWKWIFS